MLLLPLVPIYRMAAALHTLTRKTKTESVRSLRWPVVSVGNLSTGGMGKTPLVVLLAQELAARNLIVDVLSRGYGRKSQAPAKVQPEGSSSDFGDEPLLIAAEAQVPVYVAPERYEAGKLAEAAVQPELRRLSEEYAARQAEIAALEAAIAQEAAARAVEEEAARANAAESQAAEPQDQIEEGEHEQETPKAAEPSAEPPPRPLGPPMPVHLLDDGFQHRQLARAIDILLVNQEDWRDRLLPAGNLREPREAAKRATVIALPAEEPQLEVDLRLWGWEGPIWRLRRTMKCPEVEGRVLAFCGIARPTQFFAGLEAGGVKLAMRLAFADHCEYTPALLKELFFKAEHSGATAFVTTEKDRLRLGKMAALFPESTPLLVAHLAIEIEEQAVAIDWLEDRIRAAALPSPH